MCSTPSTSDVLQKCMAGGAAAALSKTTTAPIDRVKLLLQLQHSGAHGLQQYSGIRDCFSKVAIEQGWLSLWRGNGAGVARCFPNHALNFAIRDVYRNTFLGNVDRKRNFKQYVAGSLASGGLGGATTLLILYPFDFARTRLAVDSKRDGSRNFSGMVDCLKKIIEKDGFSACYRGLTASLHFVIVSRAIFFGLFDTIRTYSSDPKNIHFLITWITSQTCLITSGLACYPFDTVRRRLMMDAGQRKKLNGSVLNCWKKVSRNEGVRGFYRGAMANSLRSTGGALIITFYYEFAKYL